MLMLSIPQLSEEMKSIQSKGINPSIAIALAPLLDLVLTSGIHFFN